MQRAQKESQKRKTFPHNDELLRPGGGPPPEAGAEGICGTGGGRTGHDSVTDPYLERSASTGPEDNFPGGGSGPEGKKWHF